MKCINNSLQIKKLIIFLFLNHSNIQSTWQPLAKKLDPDPPPRRRLPRNTNPRLKRKPE
jgi:hypothetical protein